MVKHNLNFKNHSGLPQVITMLSMYLCVFYITRSTSIFYNIFFFKTHRYIGYIVSSSTKAEYNLYFQNNNRLPTSYNYAFYVPMCFDITRFISNAYNMCFFLNHIGAT